MVEIVRRLSEGGYETEEEDDHYLQLFENNVPHPGASDLIFWPEREFGAHEPTAEEIVDRALSYRPIPLPPASSSE